jgi:SAM-dependent methyltransferase
LVNRTDTYKPISALGLLKRYLQVYWLKPFDAINDTANAAALTQFTWEDPILEVGGGDGMFSFLMHGGQFSFKDDRYTQSDPNRAGDVFDVYKEGASLTVKKPAGLHYATGVDLKMSHIFKARETGLYDDLKSSVPEELPLKAESYQTVFLYLFHGLTNYENTLREIRRVIRPQGRLLMVAFNKNVSRFFICHKLHLFFASHGFVRLAAYFKKLDGGRSEEITGMARTLPEWQLLLNATGFKLQKVYTHVSPLAWMANDVQTRPLFRFLIRVSQKLEDFHLKAVIKGIVVYGLLIPLYGFFQLAAKPREITASGSETLFVFLAEPN